MNIHEHQAKAVLAEFGAPVPRGYPAFSVDEAVAAAEKLGGPVWVVKAQIHAGGRGKGGGVKLARSLGEVRAEAERMLGMTLVTHQTGPKGRIVRRLLIEEGADIAKEFYLSLLVDRETSRVAVSPINSELMRYLPCPRYVSPARDQHVPSTCPCPSCSSGPSWYRGRRHSPIAQLVEHAAVNR
jgi:hypothetical protein